MTNELYSRNLLRKILASIPEHFDKNLLVRVGEPNTLQLLKLAIRAFFNNILKCPFFDSHANDVIKALWLLQNIECAKNVFEQYNYMDYYPFTNDSQTGYMPSFMSNLMLYGNVVHQWNLLLEWTPKIMAAVATLKNTRTIQKDDLLKRLQMLATEEQTNKINVKKLAVNLLFEVGEYNSTLDKFIDIFLPIDRDDDGLKQYEHDIATMKAAEPTFSEKSMCLIGVSSDGSKILTILSESDKYSIGRSQT